jgi:hypothetical protein
MAPDTPERFTLAAVEPLGQASAHPTEAMMSIQALQQTGAACLLSGMSRSLSGPGC